MKKCSINSKEGRKREQNKEQVGQIENKYQYDLNLTTSTILLKIKGLNTLEFVKLNFLKKQVQTKTLPTKKHLLNIKT